MAHPPPAAAVANYVPFVREGGRLLLKKRDCVYDTLIIPNSMIFPV